MLLYNQIENSISLQDIQIKTNEIHIFCQFNHTQINNLLHQQQYRDRREFCVKVNNKLPFKQ